EENFLLEKIDEPNLKYLILATESNMDHLNDSNIWIAEGTFRSFPSEYKQLYVIFASVMGIFVSIVYALLDGKTISHYDKLFIILKKYLKNEVPRTIIVDNEHAVQTSFLNNFPKGRVYLCFFSFFPEYIQKYSKKWTCR
ncbi:hypothetical protein DMUE_6192, partial [Dictyocoela muelleri]